MKKILYLILIILPLFVVRGQEIKKIENDTVVVLSQRQVGLINAAFTDLRFSRDKVDVLEKIVYTDSVLLSSKDSIIQVQSVVLKKTTDHYKNSIEGLERSLKVQKRKTYLASGGGVLLLIASIILLK